MYKYMYINIYLNLATTWFLLRPLVKTTYVLNLFIGNKLINIKWKSFFDSLTKISFLDDESQICKQPRNLVHFLVF